MGKAAKAAHAAVQQQPSHDAVQQEHPSLPHLKLSPKKLRVQEVNDHMLLVPGVLSIPECQQLIDAAELCGFEHQSSRGPAYGEAFRCVSRQQTCAEDMREQHPTCAVCAAGTTIASACRMRGLLNSCGTQQALSESCRVWRWMALCLLASTHIYASTGDSSAPPTHLCAAVGTDPLQHDCICIPCVGADSASQPSIALPQATLQPALKASW